MKCPICKKEVAVGDPEFPFCGERCRLLDLGNWASERYAIPAEEPPDPEQSPGAGFVNGKAQDEGE
jgi:endogenous inhibitor of DNA gyrase (YacG/DUF329 family)